MTDLQLNDNKKPLVSIVITSYNRAHFIKSAIESALAQDYTNLEIIISDNCSTDNTDLIISKYLIDKRVKYFKNESNIGMVANFKSATEKASGEFLTYVSSDDYLINNSFISECIALINKYSNILLVLAKHKILYMNTQKESTSGGFDKEFYNGTELFLQFPYIKTCSWAGALMHRKTLLGFYPFERPYTKIDVTCNLRYMLSGNIAFLDTPSYMLTIHGNNATTSVNIQQAIENFVHVIEPYNVALKAKHIPKEKLDKWKINSAFLYTRTTSVLLAPQSKRDYNTFMQYAREHFPGVLTKLRLNLKWNILIFFFKRPAFSLKFFNVVSKSHYIYLAHLVAHGKKTS